MSLYDKASLIQVPSLYKDGLLVSTVPEDRSGDFAVARGSNLSATRIGEDGYIKKGYENLLTYSNDFSNAAWYKNASITGGQLGYDGSNNAWQLTATGSNNQYINQSISTSSVNTFSVYAKAGTANFIIVRDTASVNAYSYINLSDGSVGSQVGSPINTSTESVGNGWWRCSITATNSTSVYVYITDSNGSLAVTSGAYVYIQDAQLNQGLVAYPYVETTDAPAQGGLLENTPRLDWGNGVPAVKLEEDRTNLITNSESSVGWNYQSPISVTSNSSISPEGVNNATKITKVAGGNMFYRIYTTPVIGCFSVFAKKGNWRYIGLRNNQSAGNDHSVFDFDTQTFVRQATGQTCTFEDYGNGWYRLNSYQPNNEASGLYGIALTDENGTENSGTSPVPDGSYLYVYGFQVEQASTPSSYIPTYGTTQTRSNETVTDTFSIPSTATIYNSFYAPASEQVYILDQVFDVSEGLNKVAIAFSPTAVKISVGGSIVASSTGTYDTTSLTSISLGSDSGADYSNAPIFGFYVFPEFLTDEELNSLTA